jgi:ATP-dependent helicase HrpA
MTRRAPRFRLDFPPELPITARVEEITAAIQRHQVLILAGETGSGKTTQIPKMCLAAGRGTAGRIVCTQPRRVAALSISRRVAEELGVPWGREVGCKIRFTDQTSPDTVIKFVTDGMLLAELQADPLLREYDTIILDEAHERSLNIDFLLGHARQLRFRRPELRIVITSATIDTEAFARAFDGAPVIEVSGRTYPVEVIYAPLDELGSDAAAGDEPTAKGEALHYVDGAVEAVERIRRASPAGDILVFMPAERDIRETCDLLAGRNWPHTEIIPLFGRLTNDEQQRVFALTPQRKIIVATNIAETSLTIPGIRFVVDTGLARISRYAPQARTRRLPIEPIAQSNAEQRKGRCGRVADGVCIRLYSEQDLRDRPRFPQPEIQRCNLADVILRMKVSGLGDIERFPFLNAPPAKAVRAGYQLLEELSALEAAGRQPETGDRDAAGRPAATTTAWELTPLGRELARLPVDPTVGRMILQARTEKCLREVLVIAAGLSIQDPRERPLDRQAQADTAHRRFAQPDSDFLTLLNIWETFHDDFETMTQSRLRRFCHEHFLSYIRMREWRDIHDQLVEVLEERDDFKLTSVRDGLPRNPEPRTQNPKLEFGSPAYRAIHRSILAGLLGNIAMFDAPSGLYQAAHSRKVALFPGSGLYVKREAKKEVRSSSAKATEDGGLQGHRAARWIMAAEMVETARLYARTAARIDPAWALDLGAHLLQISHTDPFWDAAAGRVLVQRRARLYGLELESRAVGYGKIDPVRATEIFIREGLVAGTITWPFDFLAHNRRVREKIATILTRTRSSGYLDLDEAVYRFYADRLLPAGAATPLSPTMRDEGVAPPETGVSSVPDLIDLVRLRRQTKPRFLQLEAEDLRGAEEAAQDMAAFPDTLPLANRVLPLGYVYRPGGEEDGVTLTVGARDAAGLTPAALDWAVPGHLEEKVLHLLKALPTGQRRVLIPLAETAKAAARAVAQRARLRDHQDSLADTLVGHLREAHRLAVDLRVWAAKPLPDHLRVRVVVVDEQSQPLVAGRDLAEVRRQLEGRQRELSAGVEREDPAAWRRARARWEKEGQNTWTFGDIPERVPVGDHAGVPVDAYPALVPEEDGVALRLRRSPEAAAADGRRGLFRLFELELGHELAWLERDLRALRAVGVPAAALLSGRAPAEKLQEQALVALRQWACGRPVAPLTAAIFTRELEHVRADLRGVVPRLTDRLREIFALRQALLTHPQPYPGLAEDLAALLPPDFLAATPFPRLAQLPRYLQAMKVRADRWRQNAARDGERARRLAPYVQAVAAWRRATGPTEEAERLRWLVEEFRVSLFAQELGTVEPVSAVRLDRELRASPRAAPVEGKTAAPAPIATRAATGPLKNLGALDRFFPRG